MQGKRKHGTDTSKEDDSFFSLGLGVFQSRCLFNLYQLERYKGPWILVIVKSVSSEKVFNLQRIFKKLVILSANTH